MKGLKLFIKTFSKEIKTVQTYEGETYSEKLKKEVARLCRLKTVSRYAISKASNINYTLIRNWDMKYNQGLNPMGKAIKVKSQKAA